MKTSTNTLIAIWGTLLFSSCVPNNDTIVETPANDTVTPIAPIDTAVVEEDVFTPNDWDRASKMLAGIPVEHEFKIDSNYYSEYVDYITNEFTGIKEKRLDKLMSWKNDVVPQSDEEKLRKVFYPFSGGDFIHLYQLYPEAPNYLMLAIEPIGTLPDFNSLPVYDIDTALHESKVMLRDIFFRSYFITKNMDSDIKKSKQIGGILPSILWGISSSGHDIVSVENVSLSNNGDMSYTPAKLGESFEQGVSVNFVEHGSKTLQEVTYLSCDISNKGFAKDTAITALMTKLGDVNSFVKAASYLMHYRTFSEIRNVILNHSVVHIQDDTGIPFKYFDTEKSTIRLYGKYVMPVKDFSESLFQEDLDSAYNNSSYYAGKLPFSMGYHWGSKDQNQMVVLRK